MPRRQRESAAGTWVYFWSGLVASGIALGLLALNLGKKPLPWGNPWFQAGFWMTLVGLAALLVLAVLATWRTRRFHRLTALIWHGEALKQRWFRLNATHPRDWPSTVLLLEDCRAWWMRAARFVRRRYTKTHLRRYLSDQRGGMQTHSTDSYMEVYSAGLDELDQRLRRLEEFRGEYIT